MKRIIFGIFILAASQLHAQKPETVLSIAREQKEMSWYEQQQKLWKEETVKNRQNANAWYNYYAATRAMRNSSYNENDPVGSAKKREQYAQEANRIADEAYKAVPASFEANHIKWWNGGNKTENLPYLLKAYEIDPNDTRAYHDLMIHYETVRNKAEFSKFCNKLYTANDLPPSLLNWAYNLLSELDQHAVVFTVGDNDTYAVWIVQEALNFRKDVTIVNTSLLAIDDYRNKLFAELKLQPLNVSVNKATDEQSYMAAWKKIQEHLLKNTVGIPVYVSVSGITQFENDYADKLYITGLTYKYSESAFDNISVIRRNYEKRYLLDYLKAEFSFHTMAKHAQQFDAMYLPSMLKLYRHYQESEETTRLGELEKTIRSIGEHTGRQNEIREFLNTAK